MSTRARAWLTGAGLALLVFAVYEPVRLNDFVSFDDFAYVTQNPHVREGVTIDSLRWAWTTSYLANWQPLTWISHMADYRVWGLEAAGHHGTSVVLHALGTLLLFAALLRTTGALGPSAFVSALFAVHPLHVESVAWVAARRDVLSGLFWMATLVAYGAYVRRRSPGRYALLALSFALGLAAKPMLVTLPFVLLLLDFWPLGRRTAGPGRLLLEKVPLFVLAGGVGVIAWLAAGADRAIHPVSLGWRVSNAFLSYGAYVRSILWPANLAVFYPHPADLRGELDSVTIALASLAAVLLAAATFLAVRQAGSRPWIAVGWLWFLGTLLPVIGLVQFGRQAMADRYAYLPAVGLYVVIAWSARDLVRKRPRLRASVAIGAAAVVLALTLAARAQVAHWRDSVTLFERAIRVTGSNHVAQVNLGSALERRGEREAAVRHFQRAVEIDPEFADARANLGAVLIKLGDVTGAVAELEQAIRLQPDHAVAHYNLGWLLESRGDPAAAIAHYESALAAQPGYVDAHNNVGVLFAMRGDLDRATAHFRSALEVRPGDPAALSNLSRAARAFAESGRWDEARIIANEARDRAIEAGRADVADQIRDELRPLFAD